MTDEERDGTPLDDWDDVEELDDEASEELERVRANLGLTDGGTLRVIDDRYEIVERAGFGGMGVVYRARDTRLDRDVALKLVRSRPFRDEDRLRERLEREAKALAKLDGRDHVVAVYDVGRHGDRIYFTMPYIEGPNLHSWQSGEQPRSEREIVDAYLQAARGLAAAHEVGIVHRDFKPHNVLLRADDGRALVADFGVAEAVGKFDTPPQGYDGAVEDERLTATGAVLGTLPYVAPERIPGPQRSALRGTPASDQFSFCVALWEALAGAPPFEARTTAQMLAAVERGPVGADRLPAWVRPILRRGLSMIPEARFPSMAALIRAIEHRRHRRRRIALTGLVVVAALALVLAGLALFHAQSPADERTPCSVFADSAATVWGEAERRALAEHRVHAPEAIDYVGRQLDALMQRWVAAGEQSCVEGFAPPPDDPGRQCLEHWLDVAGRDIELLTEVTDAKTAARAGEVVDRLLPPAGPDGDFCGTQPPKFVDLQVWSASEDARAAALLGAHTRALESAERAVERARALAEGRPHSPDLAEAHAALAEVLTRARRFDAALREFEETEAQARGAAYHERGISSQALWAKVRALGEPDSYAKALEDLARARRLLPAVTSHEQRLELEAELEDAAGFVEYERDGYVEALAHHQRAVELLEQIDRPVALAKALNNLGNANLMLERWDDARAAYQRARAVLDAAGVAPEHTTSVETELNLGILAVELDRSEGFEHLAFVAEHSSGARQLRALDQALTLAVNLDDEARMRALVDEVLTRASAIQPESELSIRAKFDAAAGLIRLADPRGDALYATLEDYPSEILAPALGLLLRQSWVRALEERGRCADAIEALAATDEFASKHELLDSVDYQKWRAARERGDCRAASAAR